MLPLKAAPHSLAPATHHAMLAVDISRFGSRDRTTHLHLRGALYQIVHDACVAAGVPWHDLYAEDRGDGILLVMPCQISVELLLGPITTFVHAGVRRHNRMASATAQIRMRASIDAGYLQFDPFGVAGRALIRLFRLLDAQEFRTVLEERDADLGLVTSQHVHEDVLVQEPTLVDPNAFERIEIDNKETKAIGWMWLPHCARSAGLERIAQRLGTAGVCPSPGCGPVDLIDRTRGSHRRRSRSTR